VTRALALALLLTACADPPPPPEPAPITAASVDGVSVRVGGREVVVHCALTCPATEAEMTRLSGECVANPASGPHRVTTGGALLTLGCCQEAELAMDRACGHETMGSCMHAWSARCQGTSPIVPDVPEDDRGVSGTRGLGH
jgi:hypothetical protein